MLTTVKKIGPVLELFTAERPEWRLADIARALDMPKSSTHSLVATMAEVGLLSVVGQGRYRLGWNLLTLAERMQAGLDVRRHALPAMQELSSRLRETVLLAVLDRREVVYVERVEGTHPVVRIAGVRVGLRAPAHCTAVGKAMLAYRAPEEVRSLFGASSLRALTRNTITSVDRLEQELVRVRSQRLAYDNQEIVPDIACVGAPIFDRYDTAVAAVSISLPAYRYERCREQLLLPLREAAETISARLAATPVEAMSSTHELTLAG